MNNTGVIFRRAVRDSRVGILAWGIGVGLITLLVVILYPTITAFEGFAQMLENPVYQALLGEAADAAAFVTPEGFFAVYVVTFVPIYLAIYLVVLGLGITAGEEERGTVDLLLSTPVPRWRVIVEKFLALIVIVTLILFINLVAGAIAVLLTPEMALSLGQMLEGTIAMLPISLLMAALALFFSTVARSRNLAAGITAAIIIASYFITTLSEVATEALGTVKYVSFFTYFHALEIMRNGILWGDFLLLSIVTVILLGLSLFFFERRDLAV